MNKPDRRTYPGLFASPSDVAAAQRAATQWADGQPLPARAIDDEREQRYRVLLRGAVLWAVLGIPFLVALLALALQLLGGALFTAAGGSSADLYPR